MSIPVPSVPSITVEAKIVVLKKKHDAFQVKKRPNISFPRSGTTRASNRGADTRESYTKAQKKEVVSFYLQHCREHGEVTKQQNKTKQNKTKQNKT
jgi:hypothetical protein